MDILRKTGAPLLAVAAIAVATATPAAADATDDYLQPLLTRYSTFSSQQLLTEATRICQQVRTGKAASQVQPMVSKDLNASVPAALDVIFAAISYGDC
jgi:cobalamin biosynthesis protein CobD/CbiB